MAAQSELETRTHEYALRVPKVPRQFIDVFDRDTTNGNYGMSAEIVDTVFEYATLQQILTSFDDLTFSPEFITRLPEEFRKKLDQNLYPGIPLGHLEIPTTDKVLLTELLTADALTDTLSKSPVEIWITPDIQEKLSEMGMEVSTGLQEINYGSLPLHVKHFLLSVMEYQEDQMYSILVARQRFPNGVPARLGLRELFAKKEEQGKIVKFAQLTDLELQYQAAKDALDHPAELMINQLLHKERGKKLKMQYQEKGKKRRSKQETLKNKPRYDITREAKGKWWCWWDNGEDGLKIMKEVAAFLRPQYANKTIYEILGADTREAQQEVLAAFWRRDGTRRMEHEEEHWIVTESYLRPDGIVELHYNDDLYGRRSEDPVTETLENAWDVALVDQTVRWIQEEMDAMRTVKEKWQTAGFSPTQAVECTLVLAIGEKIDPSSKEEIKDLPEWFINALASEERLYRRLPRAYTPTPKADELLFSFAMNQEPQPANLLKTHFITNQGDLDRFRSLITTPQELYGALELDASATPDDIKVAYRRIAKETGAIHISSADKFDTKEWEEMNDRFIKATRAYHALTRYAVAPSRIATLGKIHQYFD